MPVDFNEVKEVIIPGMDNETGKMSARMYMDEQGKIISTVIHVGGSIGLHKHETSDEINYVLSEAGKAICDGQEELLRACACHICKKGSEHSIINAGDGDLAMLTVVVER